MLLGPLSAAFGIMASPIPRGFIELPAAYGEHVWGLMKGRQTKYIKRVPKPGGGWRYFYDAGHGGGVHAQEHMVEGARFRHGEGHFHVVKSEGDTLHVRNTATGEEHTITKQALSKKLAEHHAEGIKAYRDRAGKALAEAKANKASPKQIARLEERVKRAGGDKPKTTDPSAFDPEKAVKIAADSTSSLRRQDVYRVLESTPKQHRSAVAAHIASKRPEHADEVRDAMEDLGEQQAPAPKEAPKPAAPEPNPSAEHADKLKSMRTSPVELAANNPKHPMHEAAKAELERREKSLTPQQAIEIARKAIAIERRQADGAGAGRRASSTQADEAAMDAFAALTSKQSKAAMDALHSESKAPTKQPTASDDRRAHHDDVADEHMKARNKHWNAAEKAKAEGNESVAAAHQAAGDAHHSAALGHLAARETSRKKDAKEADAQSAKAHSASVSARIVAAPKAKPLFES